MLLPVVPSFDYSKVESIHQVTSPKRRQKDGQHKKARSLSRQQIREQLLAAPHEVDLR
jgi:hypothetical protein